MSDLGSLNQTTIAVGTWSRSPLILRFLPFILVLFLCSCIDSPLWFWDEPLFNFHTIDPGRAYRSAQPDGAGLQSVIERYGIKTVLNLRGDHPGEDWYDTEAQVCAANGVALISYAMSAGSLPSGAMLAGIINTLETAEYPILIHCSGGADRTGAISAIYRELIRGDSKADALNELSPVYLHFREKYPCMDTLAEIYQPGEAWMEQYTATVDQITCVP